VLYFWHYLANRFLTLLSNMLTDLNLTDMECCYKVFRREVIQDIEIQENRFGFEPEIVAKVAHRRLRVYEVGVSYYGRTYEEGKKIGFRDGLRALYCILRYSASKTSWPVQFLVFLTLAGCSAIANLAAYLALTGMGWNVTGAVLTSFALTAGLSYFFFVKLLFRHMAKWGLAVEILLYLALMLVLGVGDVEITQGFLTRDYSPAAAKILATLVLLIPTFMVVRWVIFPEPPSGPWEPQRHSTDVG